MKFVTSIAAYPLCLQSVPIRTRHRYPGIRSRIPAARRRLQTREVVVPAGRMPAGARLRQPGVAEIQPRAGRGGGEGELHPRRAGREVLGPGHPPGDDDSVRRVQLQVLAADEVAVYVDGELTSRDRLEVGVLAHPGHHPLSPGEVLEHQLRWRLDLDGGRELSHLQLPSPRLA